MTIRQHKSVPVGLQGVAVWSDFSAKQARHRKVHTYPGIVGGVVLQHLIPQSVRHWCHAHGRAGMAAVRVLYDISTAVGRSKKRGRKEENDRCERTGCMDA